MIRHLLKPLWRRKGRNLLLSLEIALAFAVVFAIAAGALRYRQLYHLPVGFEWRDVWIGAAVTAVLFTIGKLAIGAYIGRSEVASQFGAAASLAVLLVWVYYAAQVFLLGAEFTRVYAHLHGSRSGKPLPPPPQAAARQAARQVEGKAASGTRLAAVSDRAVAIGPGPSAGKKGTP